MGPLMQEGAAGLLDVAGFAFRGFGDNLVALWIFTKKIKIHAGQNNGEGVRRIMSQSQTVSRRKLFLPTGTCVLIG